MGDDTIYRFGAVICPSTKYTKYTNDVTKRMSDIHIARSAKFLYRGAAGAN